jgi:hypothetical protein
MERRVLNGTSGEMSFDLPRSAKSLRFSGEAKSLAPKSEDAPTLGRPRVRKPTPVPRVITPTPSGERLRQDYEPYEPSAVSQRTGPQPMSSRAAYSQRGAPYSQPAPMPFSQRTGPQPLSQRPPVSHRTGPVRRAFGDHSIADESPTMAMDHDARDVLPGSRAPKAAPSRVAPIPHFRQGGPLPALSPEPISTLSPAPQRSPSGGVPLTAWLIAAVLIGVASFFLAPHLLALGPMLHQYF